MASGYTTTITTASLAESCQSVASVVEETIAALARRRNSDSKIDGVTSQLRSLNDTTLWQLRDRIGWTEVFSDSAATTLGDTLTACETLLRSIIDQSNSAQSGNRSSVFGKIRKTIEGPGSLTTQWSEKIYAQEQALGVFFRVLSVSTTPEQNAILSREDTAQLLRKAGVGQARSAATPMNDASRAATQSAPPAPFGDAAPVEVPGQVLEPSVSAPSLNRGLTNRFKRKDSITESKLQKVAETPAKASLTRSDSSSKSNDDSSHLSGGDKPQGGRSTGEVFQRFSVGLNANKARQLCMELCNACEWRNVVWAKQLLSKGAPVNRIDATTEGRTPLTCAISANHMELINLLLEYGADPNFGSMEGDLPLAAAAKAGSLEIATALVSHGARVKPQRWSALPKTKVKGRVVEITPTPPLIYAVASRNIKLVTFLLDNGAAVNEKGPVTVTPVQTPLRKAIEVGHAEIVRLLIDRDAEVITPSPDNNTMVLAAIINQNEDILRMLLESGADCQVNTPTDDKRTPLALAILNNAPLSMRNLLKRYGAVEALSTKLV